MGENVKLKPTGGIFFALILKALKRRTKKRNHYGEHDGLNNPDVFAGLLKIVNPDYTAPSKDALGKLASDYKACRISDNDYLPLGSDDYVDVFDCLVKNDYLTPLKRMADFAGTFLAIGEESKKDVRLVKELADLLLQDMEDADVVYVSEYGEAIKKDAIRNMDSVCFPAFLLGSWHYAITKYRQNEEGKDTYDELWPENEKESVKAQRKYKGKLGESLMNPKATYMPDFDKLKNMVKAGGNEEMLDCIVEESKEEEANNQEHFANQSCRPNSQPFEEINASPFPQMNITVNMTGSNNSYYNHVGSITNNYYEGKDGK